MKKAKVSNGQVQKVWPWVKTLPNGVQLVKELPPQYRPEKLGKHPDCIVDVPDDVQPGWVWHKDKQAYGPRVKRPLPKPHSDLLEVVAEKLGVPYDDLWAEVLARKKARRAQG